MPKFDGTNVEGWIYKVCHYHSVTNEERIVPATMNMEGEALDYLVWMDGENNLNLYFEFMEDIVKRFENNPFDLPVDTLG